MRLILINLQVIEDCTEPMNKCYSLSESSRTKKELVDQLKTILELLESHLYKDKASYKFSKMCSVFDSVEDNAIAGAQSSAQRLKPILALGLIVIKMLFL